MLTQPVLMTSDGLALTCMLLKKEFKRKKMHKRGASVACARETTPLMLVIGRLAGGTLMVTGGSVWGA